MKRHLSGFLAIIMILSTVFSTPVFSLSNTIPDEYIILPVSELYLEEGEEYQLTPDVSSSQDVYLSSTDENVATVMSS